MKLLLPLLLAVSSAAIQAETITLGSENCGATRNCVSVPNDANVDIGIYGGVAYTTMSLYLDGVLYTGPNTPSYAVLTNSIGQMVILQTSFSSVTHRTSSGRGQHLSTVYTILGGTLTR